MERVQLLDSKVTKEEEISKKDPRVLCHIEPCRCGEDEVFEISDDYGIVGLFGITATDRFCWTKEKIRQFENIRSLGFITMKQ